MKISVIIPVYNVEKYISDCLKSVICQTYEEEFECIIVDDCGSDNSMKIACQIIESYKGNIIFKILHHSENSGLSAARNTGIRAASGDYLFFLDSDDMLFPDSLKDMEELTQKFPGVDLVQGGSAVSNPSKRYGYLTTVSPARFPVYCEGAICKKMVLTEIPATAWAKLIRRDFMIQKGLLYYEGILHEDEMWIVEAAPEVSSIAMCFSPVYYYRTDNSHSIMHQNDKTNSVLSIIKILDMIMSLYNPHDKDEFEVFRRKFIGEAIASYWPMIKDKRIVKRALKTLKHNSYSYKKPLIVKLMVGYLNLPIFILKNSFLRKIQFICLKLYQRKLKERKYNETSVVHAPAIK